MTNLALNRRTGSDGFRAAVAKWCTEGAEIARRLENLGTAQALDELAEYVATLDLEDQTQRLLYSISGAANWATEGTWAPGESAADFRANVGYIHRPVPAEALTELAAVCTDDFIRAQAERHSLLNKRAEQALAEAARLEASDLRAEARTAENERLTADLAEAVEKLTASEQQIDHLRRRRVPEAKKRGKATTNGRN